MREQGFDQLDRHPRQQRRGQQNHGTPTSHRRGRGHRIDQAQRNGAAQSEADGQRIQARLPRRLCAILWRSAKALDPPHAHRHAQRQHAGADGPQGDDPGQRIVDAPGRQCGSSRGDYR
jgi:hypothetical protein